LEQRQIPEEIPTMQRNQTMAEDSNQNTSNRKLDSANTGCIFLLMCNVTQIMS